MAMNDKTTVLRAFNNLFTSFLEDINSIYPEKTELIHAKKSFENVRKLNPTVIIKAWYKYIDVPYGVIIAEGNLEFFLNKDYQTDLAHLKDATEFLKMIDNVRSPLKEMGEVNKAHTAEYLKKLNKLSNIYVSLLQ
jgi:hypothetical protein